VKENAMLFQHRPWGTPDMAEKCSPKKYVVDSGRSFKGGIRFRTDKLSLLTFTEALILN
jgi:hypothetical protein